MPDNLPLASPYLQSTDHSLHPTSILMNRHIVENTTFRRESSGRPTEEKNVWGRDKEKTQGVRYTRYMELVVAGTKRSRDPRQVSDSGE